MLLVIDTNILVNALKSHDDHAKSVQLMRDVFAGRHVVCVSSEIMKEQMDEEDRIFFDTAKYLNARLVTRNYKHYPVHELVMLLDELY